MTRFSLSLRNLSYFFSANVLIVIGVAIGTAVLTGALLLGDSLKGSLTQMTLDRLGNIESAMMGEQFFPASLAERMQRADKEGRTIVPAVILRGTVLRRPMNDNKVLARAGHVQIVGVDSRFWELFGDKQRTLEDRLLINQALVDALQMNVLDGLEVRLEKPHNIPSNSVLGQRGDDQALVVQTSQLAGSLPNEGTGRFTLQPTQTTPLILYVRLETLQRRLAEGQQLPAGSVNVLLASKPKSGSGTSLQQLMDQVVTLDDLGFTLTTSNDQKTEVLTTRRLLFEPTVAAKVESACRSGGYSVTPTLTYLANRVYRLEGDTVPSTFEPYSTMVGVSSINGIEIGENEVVVNEFANEDLSPNLKHIWFEYFVESEGHRLIDKFTDLRVKGVAKMTGEATDPTWTPRFPGMKASLADWNPPFPRDQWHPEWIRKKDEDYYKQYGATPKFFIHPKMAQRLFSSKYGNATSLRIKPEGSGNKESINQLLLKTLRPDTLGFAWQDVREQGIKAATTGATTSMFGGLFAGFSLFLIVSAALLVALLFRLRMERRASEIGLLMATGWPVSLTRWVLLQEGTILAVVGAVLGIPLALGYGWLVIYGLQQGWGGLLASDSLSLHYQPMTLVIGACISLVIALLAMLLAIRGLVKVPVPALLAGRSQVGHATRSKSSVLVKWLPAVLALVIMGLMAWGWFLPVNQKAGVFFGVGFLCLATMLLLLRGYLRQQAVQGKFNVARQGLGDFGRLNATRSPGRSLMTIALLAAGCFLVVAVGAFRQNTVDVMDRQSGTGGYTLMAETDLPLRTIPRNAGEWKQLLGDRANELQSKLAEIKTLGWYPLRLRGGDDVSCLNLYQPTKPRVLGMTENFISRGGFPVSTVVPSTLPWSLLKGEGLPVFLDDHSAEWVLQKQLGDSLSITDELGNSHTGKVTATVNGSIFQSEMLISEANFRKLYPEETGFRFFLFIVPPSEIEKTRIALELLLGESHGLVVQSTADRLTSYHAVENTYIGTFQALGGLGLLLGTAGLALVILRNVQERRAELALLQAIGFTRWQIAWTILSEVGWMVLMGLFIGCLSAFVVVLPMVSGANAVQLLVWLGLLAVLVPLVALISSLAGIYLALSTPLIPALRGE